MLSGWLISLNQFCPLAKLESAQNVTASFAIQPSSQDLKQEIGMCSLQSEIFAVSQKFLQ